MMALPPLPTPRLKTQWFRHSGPREPAQQASAAAFIAWRIARHTLDRTRHAGFDIAPGQPYFDFLREVLAFLVAVAGRVAYPRLNPEQRLKFMSALVSHLARILKDNEDDLPGLTSDGQPPRADSFIGMVNERAGDYAELGPELGFAFLRYLGHRLESTLPTKDRRWVQDQIIEIEGPQAVEMLHRALADLFDPPQRQSRRQRISGE